MTKVNVITIGNQQKKNTYYHGQFIKAKRKNKMVVVGYREPFVNKAFARAYNKATSVG